ncbi:MAG: hypothetical protein ACRD2Z_13030 [Thermoanaerobaculia bacterium]
MKRTKKQDFPRGWDEQRVREVLDYYENQSDEEAAAEHEAALAPHETLMEVPAALVPRVRELIAEYEHTGRK